jgi:hypothetical protein
MFGIGTFSALLRCARESCLGRRLRARWLNHSVNEALTAPDLDDRMGAQQNVRKGEGRVIVTARGKLLADHLFIKGLLHEPIARHL